MDIYCRICGEPWEMDSLHEEVEYRYPAMPWVVAEKPERKPGHNDPFEVIMGDNIWDKIGRTGWYDPSEYSGYYQTVNADFRTRGCRAMMWTQSKKDYCKPKNSGKAMLAAAMYDVLGDDLDGAAAMIEDYEYMFGEEYE